MGLNKPIFQLSIQELKDLIEEDIKRLEEDIGAGKVVNEYQAQAYVDKLNAFLELNYFKGTLYRNVREVLQNLKFFLKDARDQADICKSKIEDARRVKKLKGQISLFDRYLLSDEEMARAINDPDGFIEELKKKKDEYDKDYKLGRFCCAYLMSHNTFFKILYGGKDNA